MLLHRTVYTYCVLLPFGLVDATEFFTPLLCVFLSYTLIALEAVANEVAEPARPGAQRAGAGCDGAGDQRSVLALAGAMPERVTPTEAFQLT